MDSSLCIVGLIGGVASGKSEVARYLERLGAVRISADEINHELLASDATIHAKIRQRFGSHSFTDAGQVNRAWLAQQVFGEDEASHQALRDLESILHPAIRAETERRLRQIALDDPKRLVVLDAPLLIEAGWLPWCCEVIFVDTPLSIRRQLAARRGWNDAELSRRESQQMALASKRAAATIIVNNTSGIDELHRELERVYAALQQNHPSIHG